MSRTLETAVILLLVMQPLRHAFSSEIFHTASPNAIAQLSMAKPKEISDMNPNHFNNHFDEMDPADLPVLVPMRPDQIEYLTLVTTSMREVVEKTRMLEETDPVFGVGKYYWPKDPNKPVKTSISFGVENFKVRSISVGFRRKTAESAWESATLTVHPRNFPIGIFSMSLPEKYFANLVWLRSFSEKRENESVKNVNVFEFSLQNRSNIKFRFEARPDVSNVDDKYPRSFHMLSIRSEF